MIPLSKAHTLKCQDRDSSHRTKDLSVRDFQILCSLFSSSGIDLRTSKSKVKFYNTFPFDPRFGKICFFFLPLHRI